jgi:D-alanine-D-alanine ligase
MDAKSVIKKRRPMRVGSATQVLDITVLMGGPSREREVSLVSGQAVADALRRCGHSIATADISPDDASALDREGIEVVFIALHGEFGESGEVQRLCEQRRLPYVGSDPRASELAMDKAASKVQFRRAGLDTPDWVVIDSSMTVRRRRELLAGAPSPCVLKPVAGGSSVDVTIARDAATRDTALEHLLDVYGTALVESFIAGRELTVGVLGEQPLPIIEIKPAREFYDYFAKYQDDATQYILDTGLDAAQVAALQQAALRAHRCLGCRDVGRVDFILSNQGPAHVLEINTIPGFTSHSLLPKAAAAAGIGFDQLCDRLVGMAMARAERQ